MTMNGKTATATVEVLTAQVRVLQVGARQVTLSVYRQLDWVDPSQIDSFEPFGRVRDHRGGDPDVVEVVGSADGVLVRARITRTKESCDQQYYYGKRCPELTRLQEAYRESGYSGKRRKAVEAHGDHDWYDYDGEEELWQRWTALPLIVLAGLR